MVDCWPPNQFWLVRVEVGKVFTAISCGLFFDFLSGSVFCFFVGASSRRRQKIKKQTWTSGRLSVVFGGSNPENRFLEFGSAACGGTLSQY
jgi:hypothetical protein